MSEPAKKADTAEKLSLIGLWILLAGLWKTGEVAWALLRGLARLIA